MKNFLYLILLLLVPLQGTGQSFPSQVWHEGRLVLQNQDTVYGELKYNMESNVVQVKLNRRMKTFSAQQILFFEFLDKTNNKFRQIYALPYDLVGNYKAPVFFEVIYENTLTLLAREAIVQETSNRYNYYYRGFDRSNTRTVLDYEYYFLGPQGDIERFNEKKNDLLNFFGNQNQTVEQYMKENKLNVGNRSDLVKIIAYYNSLINT